MIQGIQRKTKPCDIACKQMQARGIKQYKPLALQELSAAAHFKVCRRRSLLLNPFFYGGQCLDAV